MELGQMLLGNETQELEAPDFVAEELYELSRALGELKPENQSYGVLGGEWGYGNEFQNEVFEMHPYYWGDCTCGFTEAEEIFDKGNRHTDSCYQTELKKREAGTSGKARLVVASKLAAEFKLSERGCAVHCTCGAQEKYEKWLTLNQHEERCPIALPNFLYKPSSIRVNWYKYIGRGMTINKVVSKKEFGKVVKECLDSITAEPMPEKVP